MQREHQNFRDFSAKNGTLERVLRHLREGFTTCQYRYTDIVFAALFVILDLVSLLL